MKAKWLIILSAVLLVPATSRGGEGQERSYDCWVGNAGATYTTSFIRCIATRGSLAEGAQLVANSYEAILDLIHRHLHAGAIAEAEKTLRENVGQLRSGDYATILLYSYPSEWSWESGRPQKLVQSALCGGTDCTANIFRK